MRKFLKKTMTVLAQTTAILLITLLLLEVVYRFQWFDFYAPEWNALNRDVKAESGKKRILIFGDSFSADPDGWVGMLRDSLTDVAVYNAACSGAGPETYVLTCGNRIEEVRPNHVIVQLYVGNDLYDIEKPVNWSAHGFFRNLYWSISNDFRVLGFVNYRLGRTAPEIATRMDPKELDIFDVKTYSPRTRMYIRGDAKYPASVVGVRSNDARWVELIEALHAIKDQCPPGCRFSVLVIPHCTQVDTACMENYRKLGGRTLSSHFGRNPWVKKLSEFNAIDPVSVFRMGSEESPLYYLNDPHLNTAGNRMLMRLVAEYLTK